MNTPKTHPVNVSYLVVGLIFLGLAGSWALRSSGAIDTGDVRWLGPLVLVTAGVIGLVAFAAKSLSRGRGHAGRALGSDTSGADGTPADEPATYDPFTAADTHDTTRIDTDTDTRGDLR